MCPNGLSLNHYCTTSSLRGYRSDLFHAFFGNDLLVNWYLEDTLQSRQQRRRIKSRNVTVSLQMHHANFFQLIEQHFSCEIGVFRISECFFKIFEQNQRKAAEQEMCFNAILSGKINGAAFEFALHVSETILNLPSHMVDTKNFSDCGSIRILLSHWHKIRTDSVKVVIHFLS